ncbi:MAG: sulfotransferase family 2 domain-containing protein [Acidimicrobiales bacterium]|nr:sulfotransferase family 2 domain-containing protein [Acidimicrobiales bacterium]
MTTRGRFPGRNASFSTERGFVWHRVAKTGTRSLHALLEAEVADYEYLIRKQPPPPAFDELLATTCFRFTFVRNPWDRLVSGWRNKFVTGRKAESFLAQLSDTATADELAVCREDFGAFLRLLPDSRLFERNVHFQPQATILRDVELDFVGRFERYADDVGHVLSTIGIEHTSESIPHRNRTSRDQPHYSSYYDDAARDRVGELYCADVARWGYSFESTP